MTKTADSPLLELAGRSVSMVGFDRAGFFLEFDGPKLFVFNPAELISKDGDGAPVRSSSDSFAHLLRMLLDSSVAGVELRNDHLALAFQALVLKVSLRPEDYIGPEAANYISESGPTVVM